MGYAYNELIAPAILWMNPGITREEFVKLLDNTHSTWHYQYKPEQAWDYYDPKFEEDRYHGGLGGLAAILRLDCSKEYAEFNKDVKDELGLYIRPPYAREVEEVEKEFEGFKYVVAVHKKNIVDPAEVWHNQPSVEKVVVGQMFYELYEGYPHGFVEEILKEEDYTNKTEEEGRDHGVNYYYDLKVRPVHTQFIYEKFKTLDDLCKAWPVFDPKNMFDWQQEKGSFYLGPYFDTKDFHWKKIGDKYYLDELTFDEIPASIRMGSLGYTDLILTAGAIRHNAWKVLSYRGLDHFDAYLEAFPDVKNEYGRGIWDSHTSLYAKMKGMTVNEFLRFRMTSF
jgi:hypothetical protein